jgi:DNA-binding MarR family transcriptional regulator
MTKGLGDADYEKILEFRSAIRRFLEWSGQQATTAGVTPTQHQLLLAIRGIDPRSGITIGQVAETLSLRHHSAVELVDRAAGKGLVQRIQDDADRRLVRVKLTRKGELALERITLGNFEELIRLGPKLTRLLRQFSAA